MHRRILSSISMFGVAVAFTFNASNAEAQQTRLWLNETDQLIYGPQDTAQIPDWQHQLQFWRTTEKAKLAYTDTNYDYKQIQWVRRDFIQTQMMAQERYFYDPISNEYTVDKYLDSVTARYGGINSVLIWPTYPNMGIDSRNQFDWIRDMPGGLNGVKKMVAQFHRRGVRVLFPYNPWDIGTHREADPDQDAMARILKYVNADGINADTSPGLGEHWREVFDNAKKGLVIEPEGDDINYVEYDQMGWNYGFIYANYPFIPPVIKEKWLEPRHMVHVCNRWAHDHTNDLQYAFFNGVGFETWENVWGIYNEMTPRAAQTVKIISDIYQHFYELLTGTGWLPHYPMLNYGVFASKWSGRDSTLWTIINRNDFDVDGVQMKVSGQEGVSYYDVWHGRKLIPIHEGGNEALSFKIGRRGYAVILEIKDSFINSSFRSFLAQMHDLTKRELSSYNNKWEPLPQRIVEIERTEPAVSCPKGMIRIPGARYVMNVSGIEIEGGENPGVDVQMPGEKIARRHHCFMVNIPTFYMDKYPVTNAEFKKFMDVTHYAPRDTIDFLRDWKNGTYPEGWGDKPVTWVDISDARAYAKWAGKRLPHEWEWQYAAEGLDGRLYPWGNKWNPADVPVPDTTHKLRGADDVNAHPKGKSPFGVEDMVGNVWQWTDEYVDSHTRAAVIRGGSYYQPQGSYWYFPQAYKLNEHGKYLLMSPGYNRSGTIGFRCVKDIINH